jgi:polysaccharide biosynthesis/export protein
MRGAILGGVVPRYGAWLSCAALLLGGCATFPSNVPRNAAAYDTLKANTPPSASEARIGPADKIDVHVLYEPDLSRDQLRVDASGRIELPLVGQVKAAGLTAQELTTLVQTDLGRYLNKPKIDVSVISAAGDHVIVEGNVNDLGVFAIAGSASLLEVLARAKSTNKTAALSEVVAFREVGGSGSPRFSRGLRDD